MVILASEWEVADGPEKLADLMRQKTLALGLAADRDLAYEAALEYWLGLVREERDFPGMVLVRLSFDAWYWDGVARPEWVMPTFDDLGPPTKREPYHPEEEASPESPKTNTDPTSTVTPEQDDEVGDMSGPTGNTYALQGSWEDGYEVGRTGSGDVYESTPEEDADYDRENEAHRKSDADEEEPEPDGSEDGTDYSGEEDDIDYDPDADDIFYENEVGRGPYFFGGMDELYVWPEELTHVWILADRPSDARLVAWRFVSLVR